MEEKYLLADMLEKPDFLEGQILFETVTSIGRSMNEKLAEYRSASQEYREYIELWIHEIKTPIASSKLIIENCPNQTTKSIEEDLNCVEYFLEQALFYARSTSVEKDYLINTTSIQAIVYPVLRQNSKKMIEQKFVLDVEPLEEQVQTDIKWTQFIVKQIIQNAMQYKTEKPKLKIYTQTSTQAVILNIEDNGIGIESQDLPRIFEKGYTGSTGRNYSKSTGMGLYLAKRLATQLGLALHALSIPQTYTRIQIIFPKGDYNLME